MHGIWTHQKISLPPVTFSLLYVCAYQCLVENKIFSAETIYHLKQHAPIGCRDFYTVSLLEKYGIPAYYSGCMTLTLGKTYKQKFLLE